MSAIHFIRHAQAGPRHRYDVLSDLGERQAGLLADHLARQRTTFAAFYAGALRRQRQTAGVVHERLVEAGHQALEIVTDERWNEFKLGDVYLGLAGQMCAADAAFARDYEEMKAALTADGYATKGAVARCDRAVVRAWIENRFPDYGGESWAAFRARVLSCANDLAAHGAGENVAVFTSATPIAVFVGAALGLSDGKVLELAGVVFNSSVTTLRLRGGEMSLFTFNATPHLTEPRLRTFR
jgi:broad specificity phosphatase PhoE